MYLPKYYRETDDAKIVQFIRQNSFATLVSCDQQLPVAAHLPLENLPPDFVEKEMRGIVGFQIKINRLEAKFKLSQNRRQPDYDNVIAELEKSADDNAQEIARAMIANRRSLYGE